MKNILLVIAFIGFSISTYAQKVESTTFLGSVTAAEISQLAGLPVPYAVDLYKVRYFTPDAVGEEHVASGLVCIPQNENLAFPLFCYQHGTVGGREDVPSRLAGGYELPLVFSALGFVVCAADFVGLGDSPGVHPYVHASTEATAGVDLLLAAREMSQDDSFPPFALNDQLFISGYSQGGHASMAAHRLIQEEYSNQFDVTGAAHMSGPYSISEKMVEFTLGDQEYGTVSYLAWLTLGYLEAYPVLLADISIEDVFKAEYLDDILAFRDEDISLWELNDRLIQSLETIVGAILPREILKEDVLNALLSDPSYPLSEALADNDTYDWSPTSPTNLYYCIGDEQVIFENATLAEAVMTQNGSTTVNALRLDNTFPLDHGQCVSPAVTSALFFFGSLQEFTTSTNLLFEEDITMHYAMAQLLCDVPMSYSENGLMLSLHSMDGRRVYHSNISAGLSLHDVGQLPAGIYLGNVIYKNGIVQSQKIVIP